MDAVKTMMATVRYSDECKWQDSGDGFLFEFVDRAGEKLAEVTLVDFDAKLWKFEAFLPEKYQLDERNPAGVVYSSAAAKRVAELILVNTILLRA
jgi:hypothetical protein